jgi:hypothetical protein
VLAGIDGLVGKTSDFVVERALRAGERLKRLDSTLVDGATVGIGRLTLALGSILRRTADGSVQHYGLLMAAGALVVLAVVVLS